RPLPSPASALAPRFPGGVLKEVLERAGLLGRRLLENAPQRPGLDRAHRVAELRKNVVWIPLAQDHLDLPRNGRAGDRLELPETVADPRTQDPLEVVRGRRLIEVELFQPGLGHGVEIQEIGKELVVLRRGAGFVPGMLSHNWNYK